MPACLRPAYRSYFRIATVAVLTATMIALINTPSAFSSNSEVVLLDFHSANCIPCQHMQPILQRLQLSGLPVQPVDVDRQPELAQRYGVTGVPCFVLVSGGREVDRVVGATSTDRLLAMFAQVGIRPDSPRAAGSASGARQNAATFNTLDPSPNRASAVPNRIGRDANDWSSAPAQAAFPNGATAATNVTPDATSSARRDASTRLTSAQASDSASGELRETLRQGSVRLIIRDDGGRSFGSGAIINAHGSEVLIVTCGHLFSHLKKKPEIQVDFFDGTGVHSARGALIGFDADRDVGLIAAKSPIAPRVLRLAPPGAQSTVGEPAFSVGCNHGEDPTVWPTHVTAINKYLGPANIEAAREPVQGRSGGGLFNGKGELIGICNAADPTDKEGLYSALENVWWAVDRFNLGQVVRSGIQPANIVAPANAIAAIPKRSPTTLPDVAASPRLAWPSTSIASDVGRNTSDSFAGVASEFSNGAALAERGTSSENDAEVICIVRPKGDLASRPKVLVLDRPSRAFLRELEDESKRQDTRQLTNYVRNKNNPTVAPEANSAPSTPSKKSREGMRAPVYFDAPPSGLQPIYR